LAKEANRCRLENTNTPGKPSLSESDEADAEGFLEEMLLCFPVLGVTIFEKTVTDTAMVQWLFIKAKGIVAQGYESDDGFVVKGGATAVVECVDSTPSYVVALRRELQEADILRPNGRGLLELTQTYEFSSPSTAAEVFIGASVNGRDAWKTSDGISLKALQERQS
jgi:hypothetical protein